MSHSTGEVHIFTTDNIDSVGADVIHLASGPNDTLVVEDTYGYAYNVYGAPLDDSCYGPERPDGRQRSLRDLNPERAHVTAIYTDAAEMALASCHRITTEAEGRIAANPMTMEADRDRRNRDSHVISIATEVAGDAAMIAMERGHRAREDYAAGTDMAIGSKELNHYSAIDRLRIAKTLAAANDYYGTNVSVATY